MKERTLEGFGQRLAEIRRHRGLSQVELATAVGVSNRVIHYYEQDGAQPPGAILADLAVALGVSADALLGLEPAWQPAPPKTARLLKGLEKVTELAPTDQRAVVKFVEALSEARRAQPLRGKRAMSR